MSLVVCTQYSATVSTIHMVQISIQGFNISIVKDDRNHVRVSVPNSFKSKAHFCICEALMYIVCSCIKTHRLMDWRGTYPSPWEMGPLTCTQVVPVSLWRLPLAWFCSMTGSTIFRLKLRQSCLESCAVCVEMLMAPMRPRLRILPSRG